MLFLVLLQTMFLLALAGLVFYWRLQTGRALERMAFAEAERLVTLGKVQTAVAALQAEIADIKDRTNRPEPLPTVVETQAQPALALSVSKRSQALKMIRRGEPVEHIAAAVGAPHSQIRLLLKVHALIDAAT
jgi:hypothetical protein